ncbi:MAG: SDR family NAD(P)-dependent oxidoreductase, partial [Actinobacteria bacterium]|nr:SDR family NAD(P)-dependent oxidoreductase [Actinomycetota bacterium]
MKREAIIVTGASTGIGRACALRLERSFHVFAGVRKTEDAGDLEAAAQGGITPVILDVADGSSIQSASERVIETLGSNQLRGLVNNAGITVQGPLEF